MDCRLMYLEFCLLVKFLTKVFKAETVNPTYVKAGCLILCNGLVKKSLTFMGDGDLSLV